MLNKWSWHPAPKDLTLEKLFDPKAKFCFLVGAGVSLDPPSCLPTGYHFTKAILEQLIPEVEQENIMTLMDPEREGMQGPGDFLRFYQFMEYLHNWYDPDLRVLEVLSSTAPNFNHFFLAEMLKQNHTVVTTNFDSLIEYALLELQVPRDHILPVIHQRDWKTPPNPNQYQVYKLHGSMIDIRDNKDCRESIQATLSQIVQETEVFQLEEWKHSSVQSLLQNYDVIVLGFSGLDDFDVMPTLQTISSSKRILWITHTNQPLQDLQIEIILPEDTSSEMPMSDRVGRNLLSIEKYNTRQPNQVIRISVHTGQLLAWLWKRYINQYPLEIDTAPCPEASLSLSGLPNLTKAKKWTFTGKTYEDRHLPAQSLKAYQTALSFAQKEKDGVTQSTCLNNIGTVYIHQGNLEEALKYFQQALTISEELKDLPSIAIRLTNIGWIHRNQGYLDKALEYIRRALAIDEQLGDRYGKAYRLTNIGEILTNQQQLDTALEHFNQALSIYDELGHLKGKATNLNNIGSILFNQILLDESLNYYQQAFAIFDQIGDLIMKATVLNNIGTVLHEQWQLEGALEHFQQALVISEQVNDLPGIASQVNNIAKIYFDQGRTDESLIFYKKALATNEEMGNLRGKALNLENIGSVHESQGHPDEALECYQQVLTIFNQLDDVNGKLIQLKNLSRFLEDQGRLEEAIGYLTQSLGLYDQIGDLKSKAFRLNNIGMHYESLGQMDEALENFQQSIDILEQLGLLENKAEVLNNIAWLYQNQ
ncbi:MAG: tetratricopeptide repeat protein, partial [Candidatus Hodarchaeota archaeon]